MPAGVFTFFSQFLLRIFRIHRFVFGRLHRRRHHRSVRLVDPQRVKPGQWWSHDRHWYPYGFPPRRHNALTPLVDGEEAFQTILAAIRNANEYIYIAGWALTPAFTLHRPEHDPSPDDTLVAALTVAAERLTVKVLVWSGSALLFQPSHQLTTQARDELVRLAPGIDCRLDGLSRPTHCHHQKAVVIDGQSAFVGGLDLTTLEGDRWDRPGHPLRSGFGWHDVALQLRGEAVRDVEENFRQRWAAVTGERELPHRQPVVAPNWTTPCQVTRTIPKRIYRFARRGEFGTAHAYLAAIASAEHFVYLENQYLWSPEIVDALTEALDRQRDRPFRVVLVLPARADMGKFDNDKHVEQLREADGGRGAFQAYSLYSGGPAAGLHGFRYRPIYVHAKVGIVDDRWYTVGSSNLNGRGLATDTEINVQAVDPAGARRLRVRLWSEHLGLTTEELATRDPVNVIDTIWPARAAEVQQIVRRQYGFLPALAHPYETERRPGASLLQEAQALLEGF